MEFNIFLYIFYSAREALLYSWYIIICGPSFHLLCEISSLAPPPLRQVSSDWLPVKNRRFKLPLGLASVFIAINAVCYYCVQLLLFVVMIG